MTRTSDELNRTHPTCRQVAVCMAVVLSGLLTGLLGPASNTRAQSNDGRSPRVLEVQYTPVARAQVAIWIEDASGRFVATAALTEAVAYRGIGNRPGASQLNSSYRYPYGRREGVLPIWAHRRAAAEGARRFPRVVFQERVEGYASRTVVDASPDDYYCLQFDQSKATRDALDAVSCATQFSSDKGRYLTERDVALGYAEPWQFGAQRQGMMQPLPLTSVYPPRMDVHRCTATTCVDHPDVDRFADDARAVMPEIDAVTRATGLGDTPQRLLFPVPETWPDGDYRLWLEINVEGDYNEDWNDVAFPTPVEPEGGWDWFAERWGYPYRGQPSIAFSVPFVLAGGTEREFSADTPAGRSSWGHWDEDYGKLHPIEAAEAANMGMSADHGSGVDRLQRDAHGARLTVAVRAGSEGTGTDAVGSVGALSARTHEEALRAHEWVRLHFKAATSERRLHGYQVRVATDPIVDSATFIRHGRPAKTATLDPTGAAELVVSTAVPAGGPIDVVIGDLVASTHYYIGVRAQDDLGRVGPLSLVEVDMPARTFVTVSPCFVATAAYGSALAAEVSALRRFRDRFLLSHGPGRALVSAYYALGRPAADLLRDSPVLRAIVRVPLGALVRLLEPN
ncbi:MAG: hypothetical protein OXR73_16870 [Myxococcales bacterium]|nr:hypothetical protein [Myxococcales bacterium]